MAAIITVNIVLDLAPLLDVNRYADKNRGTILSVAAQRYVDYLRNRHIRLASGGGEWADLQEQTIDRKIRRGVAENPEWILREHDALLNTIGMRTRGKFVYVGFVRNTGHPRGPSVNQLVRIHTQGVPENNLPARVLIRPPDNTTRKKMVEDIRNEYNKIIRRKRK